MQIYSETFAVNKNFQKRTKNPVYPLSLPSALERPEEKWREQYAYRTSNPSSSHIGWFCVLMTPM